MTRQNPPRLIDPKNAVLAATDRSIGVPQPHDLAQRLAELESLIGNLNGELNALKRATHTTNLDGAQIIGADVLIKPRAQLVAVEENPNPGLTIGSAAGTGGSAAVSFPRGGSDTAGQIRVVCGTSGLGTGTLVTFAFNVTKPDSNFIVLISPMSKAARSANLSVSTLSTTGFPILANTAPSSGAQIDIGYLVIEVPAS